MATTTETLPSNFDHQLQLGSYQDQEYQVAAGPPSRPVSSRPTTRTHPGRASFAEDVSVSSRPKTSHVSGRRRWRSPPREEHEFTHQQEEQEMQENRAKIRNQNGHGQENGQQHDLNGNEPGSPLLQPKTTIYR